jgi:SRSO17 transposase
VEAVAQRFVSFCDRYAEHFQLRTRLVHDQATQYLSGLMQARRKNMERMAEVVVDSDEQALQHFLSNSPWDERAVLDQVARDADALLGGSADSALLIDESGITKKGRHSVGVARQWNGRLGKVDNCQVGVFAALSRGALATLIDTRLYLPKVWVDDVRRCVLAGVPKVARDFRSKAQLALEMVRANRRLGVRFAWVGMDGGYGKEPALLRALDADGEVFMADVHKDQQVYLDDPRPQVPAPKGRGRQPRRAVAQTPAQRVDTWAGAQPATAWEAVTLRDSTKGELAIEVLHRRAWLWDGTEPAAHCWHLLVRRELGARADLKYSLSNAAAETPVLRLAQMQGQRFWVERTFQDGKSHAGLDHYQARGWRAWHHHMALVMMAMLFMLEERVAAADTLPLLSCSDVETLLAHFLPRRDVSVDEVIRQLQVRHAKRQASIDYAYEKQRRERSG